MCTRRHRGYAYVSCKDGRVANESFLVDTQCQYEQLAVRAFFLGASELSLLAVILASFKIEVGQIENRYPVRYVEQTVRLLAEVAFKLVLQFIELRSHLIYRLEFGVPFLIATDEFAKMQ